MRYNFTFSVETDQPAKITKTILNALENLRVSSFSYTDSEEWQSEESSYEESSETAWDEHSAINLDWTNITILQDLHSMSCKEFTSKYGVSSPTFYYNRKRKPLPSYTSHNRTEYCFLIRDPKGFQEEFGYGDSELPSLVKEAREFLTDYYSKKYPGILDVAGEFADKVVGKKYSIAGTTVCNIRKMMGIDAYQPKTNSEN